jgi:hypothetical protein
MIAYPRRLIIIITAVETRNATFLQFVFLTLFVAMYVLTQLPCDKVGQLWLNTAAGFTVGCLKKLCQLQLFSQ